MENSNKKLQKVEAKNVKCSRGEKCKNRMNWQRRGSARVRVGGSPGGGAGFGLQQILWSRCQPDSSDKRFHRESCFWSQRHTIENHHYRLCGTYSWTRVRKIMIDGKPRSEFTKKATILSDCSRQSTRLHRCTPLWAKQGVFNISGHSHPTADFNWRGVASKQVLRQNSLFLFFHLNFPRMVPFCRRWLQLSWPPGKHVSHHSLTQIHFLSSSSMGLIVRAAKETAAWWKGWRGWLGGDLGWWMFLSVSKASSCCTSSTLSNEVSLH